MPILTQCESITILALSNQSNLVLRSNKLHIEIKSCIKKVKAFTWLVANTKINTNDSFQVKRSFKAHNPDHCTLCIGSGKSIDHLFSYCPVTLIPWHKLFRLARFDWIPFKSISDMITLSFRGVGKYLKILWQIACLTWIWMVW